jgi:hypothetical protein
MVCNGYSEIELKKEKKVVIKVEERMRSGKIEEEVRKWKEEDDKNELEESLATFLRKKDK